MVGHHQRLVVQPVEPLGVPDSRDEHRRLSFRVYAKKLAVQALRILRALGLAGVSGTDVEGPVRPEADPAAVVEARGADACDDDLVQLGAPVVLRERPTLELVLRAGRREVEEELRLVARAHGDPEQAAFAALARLDRQHGLSQELAALQEPHAPRPLRDQHVASGQEGEAPGHFQTAHYRLRSQRQLAVRSPGVALFQDARRDQGDQDHGPSLTQSGPVDPHRAARWRRSVHHWCMATSRRRTAARRNIKKAARAARRKKTISRLPKKTRTALGKQANKVKRQRRR